MVIVIEKKKNITTNLLPLSECDMVKEESNNKKAIKFVRYKKKTIIFIWIKIKKKQTILQMWLV